MSIQLSQAANAIGAGAILLFCTATTPALAEEADRGANQVIEEITVTARRKVERLIDTPVAVAVMTSEELDRYNTRDLAELTQRIPGLSIAHGAGGGAGGALAIRNVGNIASDYGADQPVSLVMDGMSFSRGHVLDTGFFDIASVEVLKGPQTLFFGKNSPAGVVSITSISPEVGGEFEMFVRASYEFVAEDPVLEAGFSVPVGDQFAFRIAARRQDMQDGWLKNSAAPLDVSGLYPGFDFATRGATDSDNFPNQDQTVLRFTAVWEPTDKLSANFKAFHSDSEQNEAGYTILYACADGPGANPYYTAFPDPTQICPDSRPSLTRNSALPPAEIANAHPFIDENDRFFNSLNQEIYTLELDLELNDNWSLTSLSSYWDYFHREYTNYDYTSYAVVVSEQGESGNSFTQELRLESNFEGPFNIMVGAFYEDMERDLDAPVQILPSAFFAPGVVPYVSGQFAGDEFYDGAFISYHQHWDNNIQSFSAFGSFEWELSEQWTLAGGARYTEEDRDSFGGNILENSGFLGFSPSQIFYSPEDKSDNISPELTLSWHPSDDVMVYGAFKTGFQSAGISNPGTVADLTSFTEEEISDILVFDETTVWGFEVGVKGYFFDGRLSADMAVYRYESEDLQVGIFNSNTTSFTLQNAAVAHNTGIEMQGIFQVNERLQLRLAGQYNKLEFDEFEDSGCNPVDGALPRDVLLAASAPDCHTVVDPISGADITTQDRSGERYGGPDLQINAGFTYDLPIGDSWGLALDWDTIHHAKGTSANGQPFTTPPSRTVTHLRATAYQPDGPWEVALVCSNCFNEIYVTGIGNKPLAKINPGVNGDMTASIAPPRLVTLQLTYRM